jgi:hypothetical protein
MTTQESKSSLNMGALTGAAAIFGGFTLLYAFLRSKDIFATDGAHRCLEVYHRQTIFFHENNHLLYPVNVFIWTRLLSALGVKPAGPLEFYEVAELMNCVAAAASLAIVFLLIYLIISSWHLTLAAVVALGLSRAFFMQATNSNEAVVGLFWSLAAVLIVVLGISVRSTGLIFISGLIFSLSMATYESMIFLAPAGLVLIWQSRSAEKRESFLSWPLLAAEGAFLLGCLVAWLGIHGWADWLTGITRPVEMVKQLFRMQDARPYLGLGPGRGLGLMLGIVRNIYPVLADFVGFRHLLTGPRTSLVAFLLIFAVLWVFIIFCALHLWRHRMALSGRMRIGLLTGLVGLLFTLIPLLIWNPDYEKLWLQPLVLLTFLIALALKIPTPKGWQSILFSWVVPLIFLAGMFFNFSPVISNHRADLTAYLRDAQDVYEKVGRDDLVVGDWGKVAILYGDVWAPRNRLIDFITQAVYHGEDATENLRKVVLETHRRGEHVYFLGLLDESELEWNSFIGSRCGVPMSDIEPYRQHSHIVASYGNGSAAISLRQLDTSMGD